MNIKDALDLFGAKDDTPFGVIQNKYRLMALDYHPDRVPHLELSDSEKEMRGKYWKDLTEAYGLIKKFAPDRDKIIWHDSKYVQGIEEIFNMAVTKSDFEVAVEVDALKRALNEFFSDGEEYIEKIKLISQFKETPLSDPDVTIRKDYVVHYGGLTIEYDGPRLVYGGYGFSMNGEYTPSLIEPIRARDRLHNKPYIPEYLSTFIEKFNLATKLNSDTISKICKDVESTEKKLTSEREFQEKNYHKDLNALNEACKILKNNKVLDQIDKKFWIGLSDPEFAFRDVGIGYGMVAEKDGDVYDITALNWGGVCDEEVVKNHITLSEDDYKLIELVMLGNSFMESGVLRRLFA